MIDTCNYWDAQQNIQESVTESTWLVVYSVSFLVQSLRLVSNLWATWCILWVSYLMNLRLRINWSEQMVTWSPSIQLMCQSYQLFIFTLYPHWESVRYNKGDKIWQNLILHEGNGWKRFCAWSGLRWCHKLMEINTNLETCKCLHSKITIH